MQVPAPSLEKKGEALLIFHDTVWSKSKKPKAISCRKTLTATRCHRT